ncbi:porin [Oxalobacteraceae bacterium R-40]|uniref:Porin n=1 Tax=Keguizhuia sedimenti TaxID=3064264 RepID=A0ABU1BQQ3_9BURK|nr:porin [Oxalobacteraceae bacterium R-40]
MKKSLLALAVLGAFAGVAQAQTNVTLYGIADVGVASVDDGDERTTSMDSGRNSASRIGFRGVEDLGGGLKASFVLENGFDTSTGAQAGDGSAAFSRLAYVGLGGGFGEVRLGRQNSPIKTALDVIDPFGGGGVGAAIGYLNLGATPERVSNQLTYVAPGFGGFTGSVAYTFGETRGESTANDGLAAQLGYANGPLAVQLGFSKFNETDEEAGVPVTFDEDVTNILLGGTYDFGMAKLHAGFEHSKIEEDIAGDELKSRAYLLGVTVPFGASKIRASYIHNNVRDIDDSDSNVLALSYTYSLSKRTTFYTTYVRTDNDDLSALGVDGDELPTAGENGNGIFVGVQHNF